MKNRSALIVIAVLVLLAGYWYLRDRGEDATAISLLDLYPEAERRSNVPLEQAFQRLDVTIGEESHPAIFMHPTSRLTFKNVTVPRDAWFRTRVALQPEVWDRSQGDGVLFRFAVSDGRSYDELVRQQVDPQHHDSDRRWIPIEVDLSPYGGLTVDLIFNTNSSLPGRGDDPANDWAVWGRPEVFVRR
jgi:hypothetical protein